MDFFFLNNKQDNPKNNFFFKTRGGGGNNSSSFIQNWVTVKTAFCGSYFTIRLSVKKEKESYRNQRTKVHHINGTQDGMPP